MKTITTQCVLTEKYDVPDEVAEKGLDAIEKYLFDGTCIPVDNSSRDFEIIDVS